MEVVVIDIETTGLKGLEDKLIAIGYKVLDLETNSVLKETEVLTSEGREERDVVAEFLHHLEKIKDPLLVGYNIRGFDLPFIIVRGIKYNLDINNLLNAPNIDLMQLVSRHCLINGGRTKLHIIAEYLGLENGDETNGSQMPEFYRQGNFKAIEKHCRYDIELTSALYLKLKPLCDYYLKLKRWGEE